MTLTLHDDLWDHDDPCLWNERSLMSLNKMASIGFRKCDHNLLYLLTSQMAAMCDVSATETAIIYGLEPVWGSGFTWFLLGERMGAAPVLGKMFCPWLLFVVSFYLLIAILSVAPDMLRR